MREYIQPPFFKMLNDYISSKLTNTNSAIMCFKDAKDVLAMLTIFKKSNNYFILAFLFLRGAISILDNLDSIKIFCYLFCNSCLSIDGNSHRKLYH